MNCYIIYDFYFVYRNDVVNNYKNIVDNWCWNG